MFSSPKISSRSKQLAKQRSLPAYNFRRELGHKLRKIDVINMAPGHTHPEAASLRTSAAIALENVVKECGFRPYSVSMSNRDKYSGCRYFYFHKDLDKEFKDEPLTAEHVILMIDVDYYLDINEWLTYGNPIMMYTFAPLTAGGSVPNACFSIANDSVTFSVSGGATYTHPIWDYRGDTVSVLDRSGNLLVYDVEQHLCQRDPTRRIVCFFPKATVKYPYYGFMGEAQGVKRRRFNFDSLASEDSGVQKVTMVRDETAATISVAKAGSRVAVTVPENLYTAVAIRHRVSKKPMISDVERILMNAKIEDAPIRAPVLFELLVDERLTGVPCTTELRCVNKDFQALGPLVHEDGKPVGRQVAPSLLTNSGLFPVRSYNNDVACIEGRVVKMRNDAVPPSAYNGYVDEFLELVVPRPMIGVPKSIAEVVEIQDRPSQRNRSEQAQATVSIGQPNKLKSFMKAESYQCTNDPRNITTVETNHTLLLSGFTYSFKEDCLKHLKWYSPGKTPEEQCRRLEKLSQGGVILRDYSRFDGTVSEWLQKELVRRMYMRWCGVSYRPQLLTLLNNEDVGTSVTAFGYKYKPGYSRKSGSPLTTDGNTVINAFNAYCAFRLSGMDAKTAWKSLGLYCGDDGVDRLVPGLDGYFVEVGKRLGLRIELDKIQLAQIETGQPITYCGRVFPDPRVTRDSFQDPFRTLSKLHLTAAPSTTKDKTALANRAAGYLVTDSLTPVVGPWCRKVLELCGTPDPTQMTGEERWKMSQAWPQESIELITEHFAALVGLTAGELSEIEALIEAATSIETLPDGVLDNGQQIRHKLAAAIGHDIVGVPRPDVFETPCHSAVITSPTSQSPESDGSRSSAATCSNPSSPPTNVEPTSSPPEQSSVTAPQEQKPKTRSGPSSRQSALPAGAPRKLKKPSAPKPPPLIQEQQPSENDAQENGKKTPKPANAKAAERKKRRRRAAAAPKAAPEAVASPAHDGGAQLS